MGLLPALALWLSLQKMNRLPAKDSAMPPIIIFVGVSRKIRKEARPIHSGLVVTSAVLEATEVYSSELIQVAKCSARKKPAASAMPICLRVRRASSWRDCRKATGVMISAAKPSRQVATASELTPSAWARRAKMAPKEIAARPMPRTTKGSQRAGWGAVMLWVMNGVGCRQPC